MNKIAQEDKIKITQNEKKIKGEFQNTLTPERQRFLAIRQALKDPEKRKEWEVRQYARWLDARVKPEEEKKEDSPRSPTEIERYYAERLVNAIDRRKPKVKVSRNFLFLDNKRSVWTNPIHFTEEVKEKVLKGKRKTAGVYVWLKVRDSKPIDVGLVRTYPTLRVIDAKTKKEGQRILLHPYAIKIPTGFWSRWKSARTPKERLNLIKEYGLLKDEAVCKLDKIVLDIDTPFFYSAPRLENIFKSLGITQGYEIGRTKSGNTRAVIYLQWKLKADKSFRKKEHIERLREAHFILLELCKRHNLKLDKTFADRINHPVWFSFDGRFYKREIAKDGEVAFYDLYRALKKWQASQQVWEVGGVNLTVRFWGDRRKKKKTITIQLPAFLRNELRTTFDEDYKLTLWKKAVKSLYKGKGGRFLNFILPAIGWAKYLGLDRHEVDRYLESLLSDRDPKKNGKDLKTAWRVARELEFTLPEGRELPKTYDLAEITQKALNYLMEKENARRQELIKDVFLNQRWLCDKVMGWLEKKGLVESFTLNNTGGRPAKVYTLTEEARELGSVEEPLDIYNNSSVGRAYLVEGGIKNSLPSLKENLSVLENQNPHRETEVTETPAVPLEVVHEVAPSAVFKAIHSQTQSKGTPANGVVHAVPLPANGRKSSGSPDPHRDKARELIAGLCERVRNFGLAVYEVHYQDRLAVYWERGQSSIKVYEVRHKQKDLREIEQELRHMLGLVLRADRLVAEGYSEDLVFSLILRARDNQERFSFVDRDGRLEVYMGKELVKVYERG